ncbi:MAG: OsmC family peroxiredoxin [Granulosicoccus sp.]|nr:OsmC family peroxiredoxin [Granulosicoccus sp.]
MQAYPHHYSVTASGKSTEHVHIHSPGLVSIESAPPAQFGGPGDLWSPETFLVAAVADCFILTFKAIARASSFEWTALQCDVEGILDRVDKVSLFTEFRLKAELTVPHGTDESKAVRLMEKAEHGCLITNSLKSTLSLQAKVLLE